MAAADGYIRIDTKIDSSGVDTGLGKLTQSLKGFAASAAAAFAVKVVVDFGKECINLASDLQEVKNVIDTTFGSSAAEIEAWAKTADTSFGLSELAAKQFSGTMGAMLKSMGFAENATAEMSTTLAGLAGDMASFYNIDAEEAFNKLRSGISGEIEPLKQLGINLSVATLEAYALEQGITTAYDAMTEAEKANLRYNYILQATADAQGDFAKTSDSYANQMRILTLQVDTLKSTIGEALLPVITNVVSAINDMFSSFTEGPDTSELEAATETLRSVSDEADHNEAQVRAAGEVALDYLDQLDALAAAGLDTAEAQAEYADTVAQLNSLVPDLNVTIDDQTGLINASTDALRENITAWKENAMAQALQERYTETIEAYANAVAKVKEAEIERDAQLAITNTTIPQLKVLYGEMAESLGLTGEAYDDFVDQLIDSRAINTEFAAQLLEMGVSSDLITEEMRDYRDTLEASRSATYDLNVAIADGEAAMAESKDAMELAEAATQDLIGTTDDAEKSTKTFSEKLDDHQKNLESVNDSTGTLTKAMEEQNTTGSLSKETVEALTAAGYDGMLQYDATTGAVTLNAEAVANLTKADYDELIAENKLLQSDLTAKMNATKTSMELAASSTTDYAMAAVAAALAEDLLADERTQLALEAELAELEALKASIGSYTGAVGGAGGATASAADKMAEAFQDAVEKIDRALALGEIDQTEYWEQYNALMEKYLTEGTEEWEDANYKRLLAQKKLNDELAEENEKARQDLASTMQDIKDDYDDAIADIESDIQSLAADIAKTQLAKEIKDDLGNTTYEFFDLQDLQDSNAEIVQLQENIDALLDMGISQSLLDQVADMDTQQANAYAEYLIGLGEEGFAEYMTAWEERQKTAEETARLFFQDELDTVQTEFTDKLLEALNGMEGEMFTIGEQAAQGMAEGILAGKITVEAAMAELMDAAVTAGQEAGEIHSPSRRAARELGLPLPQGAAVGVKRGTGEFKASLTNMMGGAISEARAAASGLSEAFNINTPALSFSGAIGTSVAQVTGLPAVASGLPKLARGAVIPPNREFVAVLGDQTSGTNIEAPLDMIEKAVANAVDSAKFDLSARITLDGSMAQLVRLLQPEIAAEIKRRGTNAVKGG